jgi:hypothetical protein
MIRFKYLFPKVGAANEIIPAADNNADQQMQLVANPPLNRPQGGVQPLAGQQPNKPPVGAQPPAGQQRNNVNPLMQQLEEQYNAVAGRNPFLATQLAANIAMARRAGFFGDLRRVQNPQDLENLLNQANQDLNRSNHPILRQEAMQRRAMLQLWINQRKARQGWINLQQETEKQRKAMQLQPLKARQAKERKEYLERVFAGYDGNWEQARLDLYSKIKELYSKRGTWTEEDIKQYQDLIGTYKRLVNPATRVAYAMDNIVKEIDKHRKRISEIDEELDKINMKDELSEEDQKNRKKLENEKNVLALQSKILWKTYDHLKKQVSQEEYEAAQDNVAELRKRGILK